MNRLAHDELLELRSELLRVTASLVESIPRATQILLDQDLEGAEYQILADDEIDSRTMELEDRCIALMALHAPVASELRHAVTIMKMSADIERSADLVVNICKVARRIHGIQLDPKMRGLIGRMGTQAQILFRHAIQAYADLDLPMAKAVDDMDLFLDYLHRQFIESIFECHSAGTIDISVAIQMAVLPILCSISSQVKSRLVEIIVAEVVLARVKKKSKDSRHELFPRSLDRISSRRGELFVVRLII